MGSAPHSKLSLKICKLLVNNRRRETGGILCVVHAPMPKVILIADDSENDVIAIRETLKDAGVINPIITVEDGRGVVAYLKGEGEYVDRKKFPLPSILLLDLKMPRMGGFRVMEWLSEHQKMRDILVIVLSGQDRGELENVRRAYRLGARSFLVKPCHVQEIHNLIRAYSTYWETAWGANRSNDNPRQRDDRVY
jgi:CheY-like chemotaxis protein